VTSSEGPCAALRAHLLTYDTPFREIEHRPAASALEYHQVVGSRLTQQAKALLLRRYRDDGGKELRHLLPPGGAEADLDAVSAAASSARLRLATRQELERQTGCRFGELPPVGSIFGCELLLDERLLTEDELYFNAGRLDRFVRRRACRSGRA
jgi:Ala-tRNA(Pro) deacylase